METKLEFAKKRLFAKDGRSLADVKLFPGNNRDATPEQMADQITRALAEIESGEAEEVTEFKD